MKEIKDIDGSLIKVDSGCTVQPFHAYISLVLSLLKEPFVSSDAKYLMIQGSFSYLRDMGYSDDEIEVYISKLREIVKENMVINSFMG
jgi:hypothetical protein